MVIVTELSKLIGGLITLAAFIAIFFPKQCQRHALFPQLPMNYFIIGHAMVFFSYPFGKQQIGKFTVSAVNSFEPKTAI